MLLRSLDSYWKEKGRTLDERQGQFYDDERLWPFIQSGVLCPPWQNKIEGRGSGSAGAGWGLGLGLCLILPDYAKVLNEGLGEIIRDAEAELKALKYRSLDDQKSGFSKIGAYCHPCNNPHCRKIRRPCRRKSFERR